MENKAVETAEKSKERQVETEDSEEKENMNKSEDGKEKETKGKAEKEKNATEINIRSRMNKEELEKAFTYFQNAIKDAKQDREEILSKRSEVPVPRFVKLIYNLARFSGVEPDEADVTREEVDDFKERMSDFFLQKHKIESDSVSYFTLISDVFCDLCTDLLSPSNTLKDEHFLLLYFLMWPLHNVTDCSPNFSREVANSDDLMQMFLKVTQRFAPDIIEDTLKEMILKVLKSLTGVIYNLVRRSESDSVMRVRDIGFIDEMKRLLESERVGIKDHAMLILIFAASEEDAKECCCDEPTIKFLLDKLKGALDSDVHRASGYSDIELMEAIRKLAVIDVNKKILAKLGCLPLLKNVLENFVHEHVVTLAFAVLSQLAFDKDNAQWIGKEMKSLLESKFLTSSNAKLKEAARNLMWVFEVGGEPQQTSSRGRPRSTVLQTVGSARAPVKEKHIMISYNHASKDFVKKLIGALENANLGKIWVDFKEMKENWLDDMAFAVENAWVVLSCVSLKYKDSENCKSEALYAKMMKIPIIPLKVEKWKPDGWLGILIVSLTYYDFSKEDSNESVMAKLIAALRQKRGGKDSVDCEPPVTMRKSEVAQSQPPKKADFSKWSTEEVQTWCKKNSIPCEKCKNLDGEQLEMLKEMMDDAKDSFFAELKEELKLTLREKSAFVKALKAL